MHKHGVYWLALALLVGLSACTAGADEASRTVEQYLRALSDKDESALVLLACPEWEANALLEFDALQGVETSLEGLKCRQTSGGDGSAQVNCRGKLLASYQNEVQEFDLSQRTYRLEKRDGNWLVCGYLVE